MARILLVEDDSAIRTIVERSLRAAGHQVVAIDNGDEAWHLAAARDFSLLVLDVRLPGMNGLELCRRLRAQGDSVPILMVTAQDAVQARVEGLEIGADDYLVKPFDYAELMARVNAQLRREGMHRSRTIDAGRVTVDTGDQSAALDGQPLNLTPKEYGLLETLVRNEGRILSREVLLGRVWGHDDVVPNVVDVHLGSLRRKLEAAGADGLIETLRGFGFRFRRSGEAT